ncbi:MAG: biotin/lipoyl-containing protein [Chitinophagales bacterium]
MAIIELIMPKMGESIMEATILKWVKNVGDSIDEDETILEIATDKVDSEVPSPVSGVLQEIKYPEGTTVEVDKVIALIATEGEKTASVQQAQPPAVSSPNATPSVEVTTSASVNQSAASASSLGNADNRFYSPLVLNIAKQENISANELAQIPGSGKDNRVTKKDILAYLANRTSAPSTRPQEVATATSVPAVSQAKETYANDGSVEIIEMDRMRKLIADHMVMSKKVSPHVTSFVEADVTNLVRWRQKAKNELWKREALNITFTPIFIEAIVKAIKDFSACQ